MAKILSNLGRVYAHLGDHDRAEAYYAEAAPIFQRLGACANATIVSAARGMVALKQRNYPRAFEVLTEAVLSLQEFGDNMKSITGCELCRSEI